MSEERRGGIGGSADCARLEGDFERWRSRPRSGLVDAERRGGGETECRRRGKTDPVRITSAVQDSPPTSDSAAPSSGAVPHDLLLNLGINPYSNLKTPSGSIPSTSHAHFSFITDVAKSSGSSTLLEGTNSSSSPSAHPSLPNRRFVINSPGAPSIASSLLRRRRLRERARRRRAFSRRSWSHWMCSW